MKTSPETFKQFCVVTGIPAPVFEHQFEPLRKWKFDYAWPEHRIALEVEGGIWSGGRHIRPKGFLGDMAKYNHAVRLGWGVLRVEPKELLKLSTVQMVREAMRGQLEHGLGKVERCIHEGDALAYHDWRWHLFKRSGDSRNAGADTLAGLVRMVASQK